MTHTAHTYIQIGVGKTFFHVDGLDMREVKAQAAAACHKGGDWIPLIGQSGVEWGAVRDLHHPLTPVSRDPD
jgi:hypothetical protein